MTTLRTERLVCNKGWVCALESSGLSSAQRLPLVNISMSGMALEQSDTLRFDRGARLKGSLFRSGEAQFRQPDEQHPLTRACRVARVDSERKLLCLRFETPLEHRELQALRKADHAVYSNDTARWADDDFLDQLARAGDYVADAIERRLTRAEIERINQAQKVAHAGQAAIARDERTGPPELVRYLDATRDLPAHIDRERLGRGQAVFLDHAFAIGVVLFLKVLPTGYCASELAEALLVSKDFKRRPVRRAFLVLNMLLDMARPNAFSGSGATAVLAARKLRLLHAGVRQIVATDAIKYATRFGKPVNQEQLIATVIGFSYETLLGLRQLGIKISQQEANDFLYLWQVFAWLFGIHPEGQPTSARHIPQNFDEVFAFHEAYKRRHYRSAKDNPGGVALYNALLEDLANRLSEAFWHVSWARDIPRALAQYFLSPEDLARLGERRPEASAKLAPRAVHAISLIDTLGRRSNDMPFLHHLHEALIARFLRLTVTNEFGVRPIVPIPYDLQSLKDLVSATPPRED